MKHNFENPRPFAEGMGEAVARRTILRKKNLDGSTRTKQDVISNKDSKWETWGDVANRVAFGNISILDKATTEKEINEFISLRDHIANASILTSGRHLQHGDETEPSRNIEVFSNCATASTCFWKFYLLLNGSGVGRCYDDDLMIVNWSKQPFIHVALDETHPDYDYTCMESLKQIQHKYGFYDITVFTVQDSREGWAQALEYLEAMVFQGNHEHDVIVFDFSKVRPRGSLIGGMQLRPSSGPVATMNAFNNIKSLKGCKKPIWWQNMYVDHYLAESVLVGGARRSARICVKYWRDPEILDYINIKQNWTIPDTELRKGRKVVPLWSANNSVGVDEDFWTEHKRTGTWANKVFNAICHASYYHGTGEPGIINLHKLETNGDGAFVKDIGEMKSSTYTMHHGYRLCKTMLDNIQTKRYIMIVNPCGEIALFLHGGYCVIGDLALYYCDTIEECEEAVRLTVRFLIRTNTLDSVYKEETRRTNRIGVSLTGIQEFAWKFFKLTFNDLLDFDKSKEFWYTIAHLSQVAKAESEQCAEEYDVNVPHTITTIKPSGSVSKLFGLTEGAHLPAMREYFRWVQFRSDDPLVQKYQEMGYKVKHLKQYEGTTAVCFPTQPEICKCGASPIVTAPEATMEQQYRWLELLEKYWLQGGDVMSTYGNQVSYTLKYNKKLVSYDEFVDKISKYQPGVRCCSVMPTISDMADSEYEYLPEEPVSLETYNQYVADLKGEIEQDVDRVHIECAGGQCPIDFDKGEK